MKVEVEASTSADKKEIMDLNLSKKVEIKTDHPEAGEVIAISMAFSGLASRLFS